MTLATAQEQKPADASGARELFYFAATGKDQLPPATKPAASKKQQQPPPASTNQNDTGALHLGLRYSLVLVDQRTKQWQPVDSERNFRKGDCVALDFFTNRSAYLYVLAQQSSGDWLPILPSAEMPDESNVLDPGRTTRVPKEHCFEIGDPPGAEKLFVVLSRDPQDVYQLNEGIKGDAGAPKPARPSQPASPMLVADTRLLNNEVARLQESGTRDLIFRKVDEPADKQEPPHSVYVVNASNRPVSRITAQIVIRHQ